MRIRKAVHIPWEENGGPVMPQEQGTLTAFKRSNNGNGGDTVTPGQ